MENNLETALFIAKQGTVYQPEVNCSSFDRNIFGSVPSGSENKLLRPTQRNTPFLFRISR
jgi:hypothetical protein